MSENDKKYFDFKRHGDLEHRFAADYLRQYYHPSRPVTDDEAAVFRFIREIAPRIAGARRCIDVGCGPTVHHALMLAPHVNQIDVADYLESNLAYVSAWVREDSNCWDWSRYAEFCVKEENGVAGHEATAARQALTRARIKSVLPINLLTRSPLITKDNNKKESTDYDLVSAFYCTEEIAQTKSAWHEVLLNLTSLIADRGFLLMSCLEDTEFYHIQNEDGVVEELPCVRITRKDIETTLSQLGFIPEETVIKSLQTPGQAAEGVPGVLCTLARLKRRAASR